MPSIARIRAFLERTGMLCKPGVVAVSGGPDSVALAHMLSRLVGAGGIPALTLAHINHQLRGEESDGDEDFVRSLPAAWRVDSVSARTTAVDVAAAANERGDNLEQTARDVRYAWLIDQAREANAAWIATGHTLDDQAETVLFRLLRGSGIKGLAGMAACRQLQDGIALLRPFLGDDVLAGTTRADIETYLCNVGQPSREDSSNRHLHFARNRLRHELLPLLQRDYQPRIQELLCQLADQARVLQDDVETRAARLLAEAELPRAGNILVFKPVSFASATDYLVCEVFRLVWAREGWPQQDMTHEAWLSLLPQVRGDEAARDFPGGIRAVRKAHVLQLIKSI